MKDGEKNGRVTWEQDKKFIAGTSVRKRLLKRTTKKTALFETMRMGISPPITADHRDTNGDV